MMQAALLSAPHDPLSNAACVPVAVAVAVAVREGEIVAPASETASCFEPNYQRRMVTVAAVSLLDPSVEAAPSNAQDQG